MPEIPEEALQAAEAAYACAYTSGVPHEEIARIVVEAADPAIRADERRKVAEEQREAGLVVVSAEDLDVAIAYACRDQDGERSPCVARLRAARDEAWKAAHPEISGEESDRG